MKTTHVLFIIGILLLGVTLINEFEYTGNVVKLPGRFDVCSDDKTEFIFVNTPVQAGKEIHIIYCNKPGDQLQATGKLYKREKSRDRFIRTLRFCTSPRSWLFVTGFVTRDQNIECINQGEVFIRTSRSYFAGEYYITYTTKEDGIFLHHKKSFMIRR